MKTESKLFESIRIRPRKEEKPEPIATPCDWEGCEKAGTHKAPKGHRNEGQYHNFCIEHVRHYNTAYNFFAGMEKNEFEDALHAPPKAETRASFATGQAGAKTSRAARTASASIRPGDRFGDPFGVFARYRHNQAKKPETERARTMHEQDRRAMEVLGFTHQAKSDEIKKAYKALVKIHHPDANGGDKSSEDRLRTIIAAYSHLKKTGFVAR